MKQWADYFDGLGLLRNGDTGDSAREMGTYITGLPEPLNQLLAWNSLANCFIDGQWVRHPNPTSDWHKDPKEFSRDQWVGVMCAMITLMDNTSVHWHLRKTYESNFLRAQNGDLITWEMGLYVRAFYSWWMKPILWILDFGFVANAIIRVIKSYINSDDTADDINLTSMLYVAKNHASTFWVKIAMWIYSYRKNGVLSAWQSYYKRPEAPPMDVLWEPIIKEMLG